MNQHYRSTSCCKTNISCLPNGSLLWGMAEAFPLPASGRLAWPHPPAQVSQPGLSGILRRIWSLGLILPGLWPLNCTKQSSEGLPLWTNMAPGVWVGQPPGSCHCGPLSSCLASFSHHHDLHRKHPLVGQLEIIVYEDNSSSRGLSSYLLHSKRNPLRWSVRRLAEAPGVAAGCCAGRRSRGDSGGIMPCAHPPAVHSLSHSNRSSFVSQALPAGGVLKRLSMWFRNP